MKKIYKTVTFDSLKIGDKFECYGDYYLNYNYPKICECVKDTEFTGQEIDGIRFGMSKKNDVIIINWV